MSDDHPFVRLLKRPNKRQSGASFRFECVMQLESTGSVLIWNRPNQSRPHRPHTGSVK
jgi:hypothetical protein